MIAKISQTELKILSQSFLFAELPYECLLAGLKGCHCLRLPAKQEVYHRGETGKNMCIILSGGVKVSMLSASGKEVIFDLLSEGNFFGELSMLDGDPRTATVTTLVPSVLVVFERYFFMPFMEANPVIAIRLLRLMAHRLRAMDRFLEEVLFFDSETRLAKRVVAIKNIYGRASVNTAQINIKISQQDMANLVGITRESVNKILKKWERANIITLQQGCLTIQNPQILLRLASKADSFTHKSLFCKTN